MIAMNETRRLGRKAYWLSLFLKSSPGLFLLAIALMVASIEPLMKDYFLSSLQGGAIDVAAIAGSISYVVRGLLALSLVTLLATVILAQLWYHFHTFVFEEFDLHLTRGIIRIVEVSIPYRQMQNINIERTLLHRLTGTARVVIDSAGHEDGARSESHIILDPIDRELAEDIRLILQRKIGVQVTETEREADKEDKLNLSPGADNRATDYEGHK